jgi:hypothetical protein
MIEYREQFGHEDDYIYVYYDFGTLILPEKMIEIKNFLKAQLSGKDCIGSINAYCNKVNGFLVIN